MNTLLKAGFVWNVETVLRGRVVARETVHNLVPIEGLNHILSAVLKGGAQFANWYVGIYEGNYTPVSGDTAADFPANATECTAYSESLRRPWVGGSVAGGSVDNSASRAEFTMSSDKNVYGGFISSSSAKGSTTGALISAVKFNAVKPMVTGGVLRVTAGFIIVST